MEFMSSLHYRILRFYNLSNDGRGTLSSRSHNTYYIAQLIYKHRAASKPLCIAPSIKPISAPSPMLVTGTLQS